MKKNPIDLSVDNYWINLNKPANISSAFAVSLVKRIIKSKKVGHGGTLDPFATGVLPIAVNNSTKQSSQIMDFRKKYFFKIKFGEFRDSDDLTGTLTESSPKRVSLNEFINSTFSFLGEICQQPSRFSAIKINGVRSYEMARSGKDFILPSRIINIYSLKIINYQQEYCDMEIECSKGTYVRTLARDLCKKSGICGYVAELKRLNVGIFDINKTISLDDLKNISNFKQSYKDGSFLALQ